MFQTGAFFSCAAGSGWQPRPAAKVGVRRKTAAVQKKGGVRKATKGAAKSAKKQPTTQPPSKASVAQPSTGKSSRKRPSTPDDPQIPDAKKPRRVATRASTKNQSKPFESKPVTVKITRITKAAAKAAVGPNKPKPTTRARQSKGKTSGVKMQKTTKSVATRRSSRQRK